MNFIHKIGFFLVFLVAVFLLTSCDRNKPFKDLQAYIDKLKQSVTTPPATEAADSIKQQPVSVKYESKSRRSPFEVIEATPNKGRSVLNPLQAYPLDVLRFVGTVTQNGSTIAFISAPDNKIYQIKAGDVIGDHDSEVVKIESDKISLSEMYSENGSAAIKRVVTLQLKDVNQ